ncbi:MAG TPA: urease accessory UreF family protein [Candidatus Synoicihabitans sp.]|nr:urease accessory UreF family protein [Candidatus Synoicihabitans sp.]
MNLDTATATEPSAAGASWLISLLQTSDSFYPTGGYAHSYGLESLVLAAVVHDRASLRTWLLEGVLPGLEQTDLPVTAHAWTALRARDWPAVGEWCELAAALKPARELRVASSNIGRQRAELAATLHGSALAREFLQRAAAAGWPHSASVAAALEGVVIAAPRSAVLFGCVYTAVAALIAAAMKLLRLGQNAAQSLLTEALALAPALVARAEQVSRHEIGWFNPWMEIAAAQHELADARLFIS